MTNVFSGSSQRLNKSLQPSNEMQLIQTWLLLQSYLNAATHTLNTLVLWKIQTFLLIFKNAALARN